MKLPARLTGSANRRIIANASSLVGTASATAGLGLVYWWFAAHRFSPTSVGLAYAAISAMTLLAVIAALGLGTLLMGELPRQPDRQGALISAALMLAGVTGGVLGVLFAVIAPHVSSQLGPIGGSVGTVVVFAAGVGLTTMTLVLDQALIGLLRGGLQFIRNIIFASTKFLVLIGAGLSLTHTNGLTIYSTWVAGILVSLVCLLLYALRAGLHLGALRHRSRGLRGLGRATLAPPVFHLVLQVSR
ncbi:MAG: lipopolysaccharide biosynthesis protein, partial [Chloroflexota bacterium]